MCYLCDQDRITSAYRLADGQVAWKAHYQAAASGLLPDGVGGDLKIPTFTPLLVATTDDVAGDTTTSDALTINAAPIVSTIDTLGDQDFFAVTLEAGKTYDIGMYAQIGGPSGTPMSDSYIELYDAAGNIITQADGGAETELNGVNSGFDALLTFTAQTSGTYYVNARAFDNIPEDGSDGDLVGDYQIFVNDVTGAPRYVPYYEVNSPLYALDWGSQVDGTVRNPDGQEGPRPTGNEQGVADTKGENVTGKNVITIYFAKAGDVFISEDPTQPSLPPATVAVGAKDFEIAAVWTALREFEKVADVVYVETQDRAAADFEYFTYSGTPGPGVSLLGSMSPPNELDEGLALFNSGDERWNAKNLAQGGFSFVTLIHEFGHGHGMAHPHDNGGRSGIMNGVVADGPVADYTTGDFSLNQAVFTMMSYQDGWQESPHGNAETDAGFGYLGGLMAFDIAVIQDKYGVNESWARGDNTYRLKDENVAGTYYYSIWDTGGDDRILYSGDKDVVIDLRPATLEYEVGGGGFVSYAAGIFGGFTVANGVTIENARGARGDDALIGNAAANTLDGGAGDDVLEGGAGNDLLIGRSGSDTASYELSGAGVRVSLAITTAQNTRGAGNDTLDSIQNLSGSRFADTLVGDDAANVLTGREGADGLRGGGGADRFVFDDGDTGATEATADRILDFTRADTIDLSAIDANSATADADDAFAFIGDGAFSGVAGELRIVSAGGGFTLSADTNGDSVADLVIVGTGPIPLLADLAL